MYSVQAFNPFEMLSSFVKLPGVTTTSSAVSKSTSNSFSHASSSSDDSQSRPGFTGTLFKILADNFIKPEIEKRRNSYDTSDSAVGEISASTKSSGGNSVNLLPASSRQEEFDHNEPSTAAIISSAGAGLLLKMVSDMSSLLKWLSLPQTFNLELKRLHTIYWKFYTVFLPRLAWVNLKCDIQWCPDLVYPDLVDCRDLVD